MNTLIRVFVLGLLLQIGILLIVWPILEAVTGSAIVTFVSSVGLSIVLWGVIFQALREPAQAN